MDRYVENKFAVLRVALSHKNQFSVDDACEVLGVKRSSALWILSNLARARKIFRLERGLYTFDSKSANYRKPRLGAEIQNAIEMLRTNGVSFALTGLDILLSFVQHQPNRIIHLMYAAPGAGEWAQSLLKNANLTPILEPTLQEIEKVRDLVAIDSELIVLREKSSRLAVHNSIATIERAFVDLYFETSRNQFPFSSQEVAHIFLNIHHSLVLNKKQMLRYAAARSIRSDIQRILNFGKPNNEEYTNKPVYKFLNTLSAISQWQT